VPRIDVHLKSDTVDRNAALLEVLDERERRFGFRRTFAFDLVVVVEKQSVGIRLVRGAKRIVDVRWPERRERGAGADRPTNPRPALR